jgi:aminoglycoside phosphotransferase family enzyme/predicted kinase
MTDLIAHLQNRLLYPHPTHTFRVKETHTSWVILTGEYAYKIKKPVDFTFLNYSTLAARKHFCEREIELNQQTAPDLYLECVAITGTAAQPEINGAGPVIEYAVKMREFPQELLFDHLLTHNQLTLTHITLLSNMIAEFHKCAPVYTGTELGSADAIYAPVVQNFEQIRSFLQQANHLLSMQQRTEAVQLLTTLQAIERWATTQFEQHHAYFDKRKEQGFIRACHGDLHLGNIILWHQQPTLFDCIEFNEPFRQIDVLADIGFLTMDLMHHDHADHANVLINDYLEQTGDYEGLKILPFYQCYRAMVRAKIAIIQLADQAEPTTEDINHLFDLLSHYTHLAAQLTATHKPYLLLTHGFSGSGKSALSRLLTQHPKLIRLRSDVERKRLAEINTHTPAANTIIDTLYTTTHSDRTFDRLAELTQIITAAGYAVIIDATMLTRQRRQPFIELAQRLQLPWLFIHLNPPQAFLEKNIIAKQQRKHEPSDATLRVLTQQQRDINVLTPEEQDHTLVIDPSLVNIDDPIQIERLFALLTDQIHHALSKKK